MFVYIIEWLQSINNIKVTIFFVAFYKKNIGWQVKKFNAYDNDPSVQRPRSNVQYLDISIPQPSLPYHDWVMCLQILKFIPPNFQEFALFNMARLASRGLVISWVPPDQEELQNLNDNIRDYVENKFHSFCFIKDTNLTNIAKQYAFIQMVRTNLIIFTRNNSCNFNSF